MREAFFILLVVTVLAALTAYRYRRQIMAFLEFWRTVKTIRERAAKGGERLPDEPVSAGPLVHCPKCGTWVPENRAIRLGRSAFYCSTKCLEASVKV